MGCRGWRPRVGVLGSGPGIAVGVPGSWVGGVGVRGARSRPRAARPELPRGPASPRLLRRPGSRRTRPGTRCPLPCSSRGGAGRPRLPAPRRLRPTGAGADRTGAARRPQTGPPARPQECSRDAPGFLSQGAPTLNRGGSQGRGRRSERPERPLALPLLLLRCGRASILTSQGTPAPEDSAGTQGWRFQCKEGKLNSKISSSLQLSATRWRKKTSDQRRPAQ
ncbi:PREDICTED: translation initiation factor IF-2-like [Chinchilla lanigera]|uniref:translation initiation factor IF-2-like n=1 Tax=Chinchilla lanigera TaxID=34839 RepID=UPI0006979378|nr:PREDICTED: translation initiation factor IF-2-like [Chinchilla lanigera]